MGAYDRVTGEGERLLQRVDGRGITGRALCHTELEEHVYPRIRFRRLRQRASQVDGGIRGQAGVARLCRRLAQCLDGLGSAGRLGGEQVGGDLVRPGTRAGEQLCGTGMCVGPASRGDLAVDRRSHDRVHELQRRSGCEDPRGGETVDGLERGPLGDARQPSHLCEPSVAPQHRDGLRHGRRCRRNQPEPEQRGLREGVGAELRDTARRCRHGPYAVRGEGADQLPEQERVSSGRRSTRGDERGVGLPAQTLVHHPFDGADAQWRELQPPYTGLGGELVDQRHRRVGLAGTSGHEHADR